MVKIVAFIEHFRIGTKIVLWTAEYANNNQLFLTTSSERILR